MSISAEVVRKLREETGAGMMDCKSALVEAKGDMAKRPRAPPQEGPGRGRQEGRPRRQRGHGRRPTSTRRPRSACIVEVNCETDFVAKTPDFQALVKDIAEHVATAAPGDVAALLAAALRDAGQTVGELVQEKIAFIKENIVIRRFARFEVAAGRRAAGRLHPPPGAKIGVLVELAAEVGRRRDARRRWRRTSRCTWRPPPPRALYVTKEEVPAEVLEKEKEIYRAQAAARASPRTSRRRSPRASSRSTTPVLPARAALREGPQAHRRPARSRRRKENIVVRRFARFRLGEELPRQARPPSRSTIRRPGPARPGRTSAEGPACPPPRRTSSTSASSSSSRARRSSATKAFGIDRDFADYLAGEIKEVHDLGVEIAAVVGGGNIFRGVSDSAHGMDRVSADHMGMLATVINALALQDALERAGRPHARAVRHRDARGGRAVHPPPRASGTWRRAAWSIFAGGHRQPLLLHRHRRRPARHGDQGRRHPEGAPRSTASTTPTRSRTPRRTKFDRLTYLEVLQKGLKVMDATAISLCMDNNLPIIVFDLKRKGNLRAHRRWARRSGPS